MELFAYKNLAENVHLYIFKNIFKLNIHFKNSLLAYPLQCDQTPTVFVDLQRNLFGKVISIMNCVHHIRTSYASTLLMLS